MNPSIDHRRLAGPGSLRAGMRVLVLLRDERRIRPLEFLVRGVADDGEVLVRELGSGSHYELSGAFVGDLVRCGAIFEVCGERNQEPALRELGELHDELAAVGGDPGERRGLFIARARITRRMSAIGTKTTKETNR